MRLRHSPAEAARAKTTIPRRATRMTMARPTPTVGDRLIR